MFRVTIALTFMFMTSILYADIDCKNPAEDYQKHACGEGGFRDKTINFNVDFYIFLRNRADSGSSECGVARDIILNLLKFERSYYRMNERLCDLQLTTTTNYGGMRRPDCYANAPAEDLFLFVTNENNHISPWDCSVPNYNEILKENNSVKPKPGFDCKKSSTQIEKTICASKVISDRDAYLSVLYGIVVLENVDPKKIKNEQLRFLKERGGSCSESSGPLFEECLAFSYKERIDELERLVP